MVGSWLLEMKGKVVASTQKAEGGLENNNMLLRNRRLSLARKNSQSDNLEDWYSRMWLRSDLAIRGASKFKPSKMLKMKIGRALHSILS